jgi:hypothetical protein
MQIGNLVLVHTGSNSYRAINKNFFVVYRLTVNNQLEEATTDSQ